MILKLYLWPDIFKRQGLYRKLEFLFWKVLCPYPDQSKLGICWYNISGRIASYFHRQSCPSCKEKFYKRIKYGRRTEMDGCQK